MNTSKYKTDFTEDGALLYVSRDILNLSDTLNCGQCFRWEKSIDNTFIGIVGSKLTELCQADDFILFKNVTKNEFNSFWYDYFDLNTDYQAIQAELSFDTAIKAAYEYAGGIRILRQPSFETLCSFIISQNNNIPRIKGCINKLCQKFGEPIDDNFYGFPTAEALAALSKEDLAGLSLGYRDEYIIDCAQKIVSKEIDLDIISTADIDEARRQLRLIKGVGPKVAECVLLFGFYRIEAFPVDTWIKKVLNYFYKDGFPVRAKAYAGIAQQYLFHYMRTCKDAPKV